MRNRMICAYSFPADLVDRLQELLERLNSDPKLAVQFTEAGTELLPIDERGFTPEDYVELQRLTTTTLTGDALIMHAMLNGCSRVVTSMINRNNAQRRARRRVTASRVVAVFIDRGLAALKPATVTKPVSPPIIKPPSAWERKATQYLDPARRVEVEAYLASEKQAKKTPIHKAKNAIVKPQRGTRRNARKAA